jgi:exodeoxyribonuclease V gamma subunit
MGVRNRIVVRHHLQPFHKDYFNRSSALFSYSTENCTAADARQTGGGGSALLKGIPLPPPDTDKRDLTIDQLGAFLRNPAGSFLKRIGIRIEGLQAPMEDSEPFVTDGLDRYTLGNELVEAFLNGEDPGRIADSVLARGTLPPAGPGRVAFAALRGKAERFAAAVAPFAALPALEPLDVDEIISGFRLTGRLLCINSEGLLRYRCATLKARDLLNCWVQHLVLNFAAPDGYPRESFLLAIDGRWRFARCDNALEHLETLANLYQDGLCEPLPFFPETSHAFVVNPEKPEKLISAWNGFRSGKVQQPGERQREDSFDLFFGSIPPDELFASARFRKVSQVVFAPLLSCLQKE